SGASNVLVPLQIRARMVTVRRHARQPTCGARPPTSLAVEHQVSDTTAEPSLVRRSERPVPETVENEPGWTATRFVDRFEHGMLGAATCHGTSCSSGYDRRR